MNIEILRCLNLMPRYCNLQNPAYMLKFWSNTYSQEHLGAPIYWSPAPIYWSPQMFLTVIYGDDALDRGALGGPNLGAWSLSRTPPHFSGSSRPANMRGPPNYCSILIFKATAIHLFLLIATPSPVLGSFYSHTSHLCPSVHQDFTLD